MGAHFRITSVDYEPEDLNAQVPFEGELTRRIAGTDRPDYWLAQLRAPLKWNDKGAERSVTHLVLCSRYVGQTITEDFSKLTVGIAYVTDPSLLSDSCLDLSNCRYVAIGEMERIA